jgi:hypothetical protein
MRSGKIFSKKEKILMLGFFLTLSLLLSGYVIADSGTDIRLGTASDFHVANMDFGNNVTVADTVNATHFIFPNGTEIGQQGPQGDIGLTGATGPQGTQGPQGTTGSAGANGLNANQPVNSASWVIHTYTNGTGTFYAAQNGTSGLDAFTSTNATSVFNSVTSLSSVANPIIIQSMGKITAGGGSILLYNGVTIKGLDLIGVASQTVPYIKNVDQMTDGNTWITLEDLTIDANGSPNIAVSLMNVGWGVAANYLSPSCKDYTLNRVTIANGTGQALKTYGMQKIENLNIHKYSSASVPIDTYLDDSIVNNVMLDGNWQSWLLGGQANIISNIWVGSTNDPMTVTAIRTTISNFWMYGSQKAGLLIANSSTGLTLSNGQVLGVGQGVTNNTVPYINIVNSKGIALNNIVLDKHLSSETLVGNYGIVEDANSYNNAYNNIAVNCAGTGWASLTSPALISTKSVFTNILLNGNNLGINHLLGVVPSAAGWGTAPSNLAYSTDGSYTTTTTKGQTNTGGYGLAGSLTWNMSAIYNVDVSVRLTMGTSVSGVPLVKMSGSDDNGATWFIIASGGDYNEYLTAPTNYTMTLTATIMHTQFIKLEWYAGNAAWIYGSVIEIAASDLKTYA